MKGIIKYDDLLKHYGEPTIKEVVVQMEWSLKLDSGDTVIVSYSVDKSKLMNNKEQPLYLLFNNVGRELQEIIQSTYSEKTAEELLEIQSVLSGQTWWLSL